MPPPLGTSVRLCLKDLYSQDVVEMIDRETRKYEVESIEHPDHPDYPRAYEILWEGFGAHGEMESEVIIRQMLLADPYAPLRSGTLARYFLLVARDRATGAIRGVRDGRVLVNPAYAPDLCLVYLSHIFMLPEARGTVLTYWLRIAPVDLAMSFLHGLQQRGMLALPAPDAPGKYYGMRIDLAAEMEYFDPAERLSLQRILFYGRGGFDVIDPRHFPYRQPDFRPAELIAATGDQPRPFMLLLRRMAREREARLPLGEARAVMRLLYDDFATFCEPQYLATSLDVVMARLAEREASGKTDVALLPMPTGAHDLRRLRPLFRYDVFRRHYGRGPGTAEYLDAAAPRVTAVPNYLDVELARLAVELGRTQRSVYLSRDQIDPEPDETAGEP
ncbi:MAG TPA: hypothetical protein VNO26_02655 [Candidatus Limnocylindria bacterium]|nr:hypothetical protein [Candidatus Limnocylindria bacterium]